MLKRTEKRSISSLKKWVEMTHNIRLTNDEMSYIAFFESLTGVIANDCIIDNIRDQIIFIVKPGNIGHALEKRGSRIKMMKRMVQKDVKVIEYADDPVAFIKNSLAPARIEKVRIITRPDNKKVAFVNVDDYNKGIAIGKNGKTAEMMRMLARRYFQIDDVKII